MNEWWQSLSLAQQVFYGIAFVSTLVLLVQIALGFIGADHAADVDVDVSGGAPHHSSGLGVFSVQSIAVFLAGFGWGGVIWLNRGFGLLVAGAAGTVVGLVMMAAAILLMRLLMRLRDSGTLDYHNAIGESATVYCPIPPNRGAGGQVEVMIQSRLVFADAVTEAPEVLKTGSKVRICALRGESTFVVEPL
jgi:hypothetical protein